MNQLFEQLKERRIWRTFVAYPGVSFVLLQAVEFFINNYGLDQRLLTATFISLIGFLPAVFIWNWFHGESGSQSFQKPEVAAYIFIPVVTLGLASWWWTTTGPSAPGPMKTLDTARSIAVMPFTNAEENKEVQYLCDGISESLINWLAAQDEVRVSSKSSSFRMRNEEADPQQLGQQLGVDSVLQGSLEKIGDQIVISASLVDTRDGSQIWGERLMRPNTQLLALERNIVEALTNGLRLKFTDQQSTNARSGGTDNALAYQHYLRGHYLIQATSGESIDQGLEELRTAIRLDPAFGLPYADIADALVQKIYYGIDRSEQSVGEARIAAQTAIALAPGLAEAHTALAGIHAYYDFDWAAGEREHEAAIALNPKSPVPFHRYSDFLWLTLRFERAIEMANRGLEIDPLDSSSLHGLGFSLMLAGQSEASVKAFGDWNRFHPQSTWSYAKYGMALALDDQCEAALHNMKQVEQRTSGNAAALISSWLAWVYEMCDAKDLLEQARIRILKPSVTDTRGDPAALIWLGLLDSDVEFVLEVMQREYEQRSTIIPFFAVFGMEIWDRGSWTELNSDPRYIKMMSELNFPQAGQ